KSTANWNWPTRKAREFGPRKISRRDSRRSSKSAAPGEGVTEAARALERRRSATIYFPMSEFIDTVVRVRYAETDKMGIVYYGNYFVYFEIGRVEYLRQRGLDYRRMELDDDSFTVVAEARCRYRRPARYDDPLRIRTRVTA